MGTGYRKMFTEPLRSDEHCQRLDIADRPAEYFGLELQPTNAKGKGR